MSSNQPRLRFSPMPPKKRPPTHKRKLTGMLLEDMRNLGIASLTVGQVADKMQQYRESIPFYCLTVRSAFAHHREDVTPSALNDAGSELREIPLSKISRVLGFRRAFKLVTFIHSALKNHESLAQELWVMNRLKEIGMQFDRTFSSVANKAFLGTGFFMFSYVVKDQVNPGQIASSLIDFASSIVLATITITASFGIRRLIGLQKERKELEAHIPPGEKFD